MLPPPGSICKAFQEAYTYGIVPKPNFALASISIRNFRGVQDLDLNLDAAAPTILIGPNNAGKSTVLDAFGLVLGAPKFAKFMPCEEDLWRPMTGTPATEFEILVKFEPRAGGTLPAVKGGLGDPVDVTGILCTGSAEGGLSRVLVGDDGKPILLLAGTPISKAKQSTYQGFGLNSRRYARPSSIQQWMPLTWYLESKTLSQSLYDWRSGPLQQLLKQYREDLLTSKWKTASGRDMPDALQKAHDFVLNQALPTPFWKDKLSKTMVSRFQAYLGRHSGVTMEPSLNPIEEWIASEFRMLVSSNPNAAPVEARRMGDGWQNLLRLAAIETVADLAIEERSATVLLEEPETYLHPHLRRRLRRSLEALQARGYQVIAATHAPEMISFRERQKVIRLGMTAAGAVSHEYATVSASAALQQQEKLSERGNHEMVFANLAVLAEGKDDVFALRMGMDKLGIDCDAESISVVDCGSVGNLPDYAEVCGSLGIPWVAVHDEDVVLSTGAQKPNTAVAVGKLLSTRGASDTILSWDNDLEEVLGCAAGKAKPEWIETTHGGKTWAALLSDPTLAKYCSVVAAIELHMNTVL